MRTIEEIREELSNILDELTAVGRECDELGHEHLDDYQHALEHVDKATRQVEELLESLHAEGVRDKYSTPRL